MKRLLKNSIYITIVLAILFMASRTFGKPPTPTLIRDDFSEIHEIALSGDEPQEKVDHIAFILESKHENVRLLTGTYGLNPVTKTNYVQYEVHLRFELSRRATSFIPIDAVEEKRTQILGELAIATAELLSAVLHIPNVNENILHEMIIFVETVYYDPETFGKYKQKRVYLFEDKHVKSLISEKTRIEDWTKYQVPLDFFYSLPNTGPAERQQPPPSR